LRSKLKGFSFIFNSTKNPSPFNIPTNIGTRLTHRQVINNSLKVKWHTVVTI